MNDARVENYPLLMRYQARKGRDPNVFILISPNVSATDTSFQAWSASNGVGYIFIGCGRYYSCVPLPIYPDDYVSPDNDSQTVAV